MGQALNGGERYARYRAPIGDGQKLILPPPEQWPAYVEGARERLAGASLNVVGQPLARWAQSARREVLSRSAAYAGVSWGDAPSDAELQHAVERPLIVTGHQSELFHPGVWLKNFVADQMARSCGGAALNLIIDGDLCRRSSIDVPGGSVDQPRTTVVPFDAEQKSIPWEQRRVVERALWRSFPQRVLDAGRPLIAAPLLLEWWQVVEQHEAATARIGSAFAQARRRLEVRWGLRNWELPQSELCQTKAFRQFLLHILGELPRFVAAYNGALAEYRIVHRLRNRAQPAPDLDADGKWIEAPFWMWTAEDPRRRALFIRLASPAVELADKSGWTGRLDLDDESSALADLARWESRGVKIRSRALTTTLFARLAFADVFIHGIGGAKYDQATEEIARRFWGCQLPPPAVVSGTLHMPIDHAAADLGEPSRIRRRLRDLQFHGETLLAAHAAELSSRASRAAEAANKKLAAIRTPKTREIAAQRHALIAAANRTLYDCLAPVQQRLLAQLETEIARDRSVRILDGREYPFCLFPEVVLRGFLLDNPAPPA